MRIAITPGLAVKRVRDAPGAPEWLLLLIERPPSDAGGTTTATPLTAEAAKRLATVLLALTWEAPSSGAATRPAPAVRANRR